MAKAVSIRSALSSRHDRMVQPAEGAAVLADAAARGPGEGPLGAEDLAMEPHKIQGGGYSMAALTQLEACGQVWSNSTASLLCFRCRSIPKAAPCRAVLQLPDTDPAFRLCVFTAFRWCVALSFFSKTLPFACVCSLPFRAALQPPDGFLTVSSDEATEVTRLLAKHEVSQCLCLVFPLPAMAKPPPLPCVPAACRG